MFQLRGVFLGSSLGCHKTQLPRNRFPLAFKIGLALNVRELWLAMGRRALECLDITWAKKAYRQAPATGMVMYLDRIQTVEDKLLLSGHVSALFGDFAKVPLDCYILLDAAGRHVWYFCWEGVRQMRAKGRDIVDQSGMF